MIFQRIHDKKGDKVSFSNFGTMHIELGFKYNKGYMQVSQRASDEFEDE